jgi:hypothetical protein
LSSNGKELEEPPKPTTIQEAAVRHAMDYGKASEDREWDASAADGRLRNWAGGPDKGNVDWAKYREGFAWYNSDDAENYAAYKLPHHDISNGRLIVVWRGVAAAGAVLQGGRGGADIPDADMAGVKAHLARHYREYDRTPPWEAEKASEMVQAGKPQENLEVERKLPEKTENTEKPVEEKKVIELAAAPVPTGKGIVAAESASDVEIDRRIIDKEVRLKKQQEIRESVVKRLKGGSLKEQWNAPVGLVPAPAARLRNFVLVSEIMVGAAGDTVTVPYVKDFDLDILANVGDAFTPKTGLTGTVTTTLKEAGATTDITYADIEKMTEEIMGRLEGNFEQAAFRAEDKDILDLLYADASVPELDKSGETGTNLFPASYIAEALGVLGAQGKEVQADQCVLVINWACYDYLLRDIAGTQALAFARPDVVRSGVIGSLMGVAIAIGNYLPSGGTPAYYSAYLIHRNAAVLAPKRELLLETERNTRDRKVKLTGSHTFGRVLLDDTAAVEIKTKVAA